MYTLLVFLSSMLNHCNYSLRMLFKKQNHGYFPQLQNPKTALQLFVKLNKKKKKRLSAKNSKNRSKTN